MGGGSNELFVWNWFFGVLYVMYEKLEARLIYPSSPPGRSVFVEGGLNSM